MDVKTFISNYFEANCYLIVEGTKSIVIDPCVSYNELYKYEKSQINGVFITHGHFDHICELESYLKRPDVKFYMHKNCLEKIEDSNKNLSVYMPKKLAFMVPKDRIVLINDNTKFNLLDNNVISVIETPGHTDDSVCILIGDYMFSGDTLFKGTIGRCDLYSANYDKMVESLRRIKKLKKNYLIYPGHSEATTLDNERLENKDLNRS